MRKKITIFVIIFLLSTILFQPVVLANDQRNIVLDFLYWFLFEAGSEETPSENIIKGIINNKIIELLVNKILNTDTSFIKNQAINKIYRVAIRIIRSLLILLLTYLGLSAIIGRHTQITEIVYKLIVIAIILIIFPRILFLVLSLVNALCRIIVGYTVGEVKIYNFIKDDWDTILYFVFLVITAILLIRLLIYYYIRWFEIIFMYLFSPYVLYLWLGGNDGLLNTFMRELAIIIFTPVIHSIQLAIYLSISLSDPKYFSNPIEQILLTIAAMIVMLKTPTWLTSLVHNIPSNHSLLRQLFDILSFRRERMLLNTLKRKLV